MNEPPRNNEELLNKKLWIFLLVHALLMGIGIVLAIELPLQGYIPLNEMNLNHMISYVPEGASTQYFVEMKARTMFMTTLYIIECVFIWNFRRPNQSILRSFFKEFSPAIFFLCGFTFALHFLVIYFSGPLNYAINDYLGLNFQLNFLHLSLNDWLICILLSLPGLVGIEIFKWIARKKKIHF